MILEYENVLPKATYSLWNNDTLFQSIMTSIEAYTLVDVYRCYELWKLVEQSSKLHSGHIIEIGVWLGGTGALLAQQAQNCDIDDKIFLCDTIN